MSCDLILPVTAGLSYVDAGGGRSALVDRIEHAGENVAHSAIDMTNLQILAIVLFDISSINLQYNVRDYSQVCRILDKTFSPVVLSDDRWYGMADRGRGL